MDLRNKKVVVVGLGTSGLDACCLLDDAGAVVFATDNADSKIIRRSIEKLEHRYVQTEIGRHTEEFLKGSYLIVTSPGVNKDALPIRYATTNNIPIISELELGFNFTKGPIIAVTGTNGKSTVVTLLGEILKKAGKKVVVCGNIGNSLSGEALFIDRGTICVLETSSFQLERIVDFRPTVSCILNITDDHLDRYRDFDDYARAKLKIFSNQLETDIAILNHDDSKLGSLDEPSKFKRLYYSRIKKVEGIYFKNGDVIYNAKNKTKKLFTLPSMNLKGDYNLENILAAVLISLTQGVKLETIERALKEFKPLAHRMESIREIEGIEFLDDSKATNIDATKRALESIDKMVVLIAGGRSKGSDFDAIRDQIRSKVKKMILIGEAAPLIEKAFSNIVETERALTLEDATSRAYKVAKKNEVVLLSPMCSSFDMFRDYEHRGEVFCQTVRKI